MADAVLHINNDKGAYTCSECGEEPRDVDMFQFDDKPWPHDWLCSRCLVACIQSGALQLISDQQNAADCSDCGTTIDLVSDDLYCSSCWDARYKEGLDDHEDPDSTCNNCGDDSEVYCYDHAKEEWALVDEGEGICDGCSLPEGPIRPLRNLCKDCLDKVTVEAVTEAVTVAKAAEPFEVEWT